MCGKPKYMNPKELLEMQPFNCYPSQSWPHYIYSSFSSIHKLTKSLSEKERAPRPKADGGKSTFPVSWGHTWIWLPLPPLQGACNKHTRGREWRQLGEVQISAWLKIMALIMMKPDPQNLCFECWSSRMVFHFSPSIALASAPELWPNKRLIYSSKSTKFASRCYWPTPQAP